MADVFRINTSALAAGSVLDVDCAAYRGKAMVYVIEAGQTLTGIAGAFGTTVKVLETLNNIPNINRIAAGQKLVVPKK